MNFSSAVRGISREKQNKGGEAEAMKEKRFTTELQSEVEDNARQTEVVCMSLGSGELYTTMINLTGRTPIRSDEEGDTSERISKIREEVRELYCIIVNKTKETTNRIRWRRMILKPMK